MISIKSVTKLPENFLSLPTEEQNLQVDMVMMSIEGTKELDSDPRHLVFEDEEQFRVAILARRELIDPAELLRHELSHAECGKALGFTAIRFGLTYEDSLPGRNFVSNAVTFLGGSVILPNIAYAATFAAPKKPSRGDVMNIRKHGYHSVQFLTERIELWNNSDHSFTIPMPGSFEIDS
ncbi:MAG TPA: hypothetical protein VII94_05315 [Candidatus Saccharimonadales bacterium]